MLSQRFRAPALDRSVLLARHGYLFTASLSEDERRRLYREGALPLRFLGRQTLLVSGDAGVELFYDETKLMRHKAVPAPVATAIFGPGALHGLDDAAHLNRKNLFRHALRQTELDRLIEIAGRRWSAELGSWSANGGGDVYTSSIAVFGTSIMEWAGIEESESEMRRHARWLAEIVDGFGVIGPPYVKAARARRRCDDWAKGLVRRSRNQSSAQSDSWVDQVSALADVDGNLLPEGTAAVELLNVLRPTVAVAWLASFAAQALMERPEWAELIREGSSPLGSSGVSPAEAFAHEVRRYYPFVPILAARARHELEFAGHHVPAGHRVLLDVYGTNHGPEWEDPWSFDPTRFRDTHPCEMTHFIPQGGGPVDSGHRCPGEGFSNGLLSLTVTLLAGLETMSLPHQDQQFSLRRMPTRPASGTRILV
jgi:fatty-acid peroxygenase